jgi:hypothetical protein
VRNPCCLLVVVATLLSAAQGTAQVYTRFSANGVVEATNVPDSTSYHLTYPGKGTLIHSRGFRRAVAGQYDVHVEAAAALHQVSADLIRAVIAVESEFDQWAVSSKGARGLMQLMPATARRFGVRDAFDARDNIFAGTQYLRILLDMFAGDVSLALAAYNAGENAVLRYGGIPPYRETRGYVAKVQALLGGFAPAVSSASAQGKSASFFTPSPSIMLRPPTQKARTGARGRKLELARPKTWYRWRDDGGVTHVAEAPPAEGTVYQTVRALD